MTGTTTARTTFLSDDRAAWVQSWGERCATLDPISSALGTLDSCLKAELAGFTIHLGEATLLAETVMGTGLFTGVGPILADELEEMLAADTPDGEPMNAEFESSHSLPPGQASRLVARMREAGPTVDLAIRDALSRWWAMSDRSMSADGFAAVGIRIVQ